MKVLFTSDLLNCSINLLNLYIKTFSTPWLVEGIVEALPKVTVLLSLNDCQNLAFGLLVLLLLCGLKTAIQVLSPIVLAVLPEMVTLFDTGLEMQVYFFDGERHSIQNIAPPSCSLEVALVLESSLVEPEKGPVDLHARYPQRFFGREWDLT
jgi:hypothetical protein